MNTLTPGHPPQPPSPPTPPAPAELRLWEERLSRSNTHPRFTDRIALRVGFALLLWQARSSERRATRLQRRLRHSGAREVRREHDNVAWRYRADMGGIMR